MTSFSIGKTIEFFWDESLLPSLRQDLINTLSSRGIQLSEQCGIGLLRCEGREVSLSIIKSALALESGLIMESLREVLHDDICAACSTISRHYSIPENSRRVSCLHPESSFSMIEDSLRLFETATCQLLIWCDNVSRIPEELTSLCDCDYVRVIASIHPMDPRVMLFSSDGLATRNPVLARLARSCGVDVENFPSPSLLRERIFTDLLPPRLRIEGAVRDGNLPILDRLLNFLIYGSPLADLTDPSLVDQFFEARRRSRKLCTTPNAIRLFSPTSRRTLFPKVRWESIALCANVPIEGGDEYFIHIPSNVSFFQSALWELFDVLESSSKFDGVRVTNPSIPAFSIRVERELIPATLYRASAVLEKGRDGPFRVTLVHSPNVWCDGELPIIRPHPDKLVEMVELGLSLDPWASGAREWLEQNQSFQESQSTLQTGKRVSDPKSLLM